jgi:hypothetical protein
MNQSEKESSRPQPLKAGIVYGDLIYWITIFATLLVLLGTLMTFTGGQNYIDPAYLLSEIWNGKSVEQIWVGAVGEQPNGHWYLSQLGSGNGMTMAGIALGVFSVLPAILAAAYVLLREKRYIFAALALLAAMVTFLAMLP